MYVKTESVTVEQTADSKSLHKDGGKRVLIQNVVTKVTAITTNIFATIHSRNQGLNHLKYLFIMNIDTAARSAFAAIVQT